MLLSIPNHTVIHDGRSYVLSGDTLIPCGLHIQIQPRLSTILSRIPKVPLQREVRICGSFADVRIRLIGSGSRNCGTHAALYSLETNLLHSGVHLKMHKNWFLFSLLVHKQSIHTRDSFFKTRVCAMLRRVRECRAV